jgi:uncharacterized protein YggE
MMKTMVTLVVVLCAGSASLGQEKSAPIVPSITVEGIGEIHVKPDMATIQIGVASEAVNAADALAQNNHDMQTLFELLRHENIAERDIQTINFSVGPKYEYDRGGKLPPRIVGYEVNNQVRIKVRKQDKLGGLLDTLVRGGANRVQGISFSVAEPDVHQAKARRQAIQRATSRAEDYASEAGVRLGRPLLIQEQSFVVPQPMMFARGMADAAGAAVPIAAGEQTITARVVVTFGLTYAPANP